MRKHTRSVQCVEGCTYTHFPHSPSPPAVFSYFSHVNTYFSYLSLVSCFPHYPFHYDALCLLPLSVEFGVILIHIILFFLYTTLILLFPLHSSSHHYLFYLSLYLSFSPLSQRFIFLYFFHFPYPFSPPMSESSFRSQFVSLDRFIPLNLRNNNPTIYSLVISLFTFYQKTSTIVKYIKL